MQCCVHIIDTVAFRQHMLHFMTDISCLVHNGAKMVLKGLSRHPQLTVSMRRTDAILHVGFSKWNLYFSKSGYQNPAPMRKQLARRASGGTGGPPPTPAASCCRCTAAASSRRSLSSGEHTRFLEDKLPILPRADKTHDASLSSGV